MKQQIATFSQGIAVPTDRRLFVKMESSTRWTDDHSDYRSVRTYTCVYTHEPPTLDSDLSASFSFHLDGVG